jgi:hypothetical protein
MAPPDGLEPPTRTLGRCRSVQLSYGGRVTGYPYDRPVATDDEAADLVLYVTANCHLCADAAILLDELVGPNGYRVVDVETDGELLGRYGGRVPVLTADGRDRLEAPITGPDLVELLGELGYSTMTVPFMPGWMVHRK